MKRLSKKKNIAIWIVLIILIIIGLRVFTKSKASKIETITANFKDNSGILSDEISEVLATNEGESGVSLILPDIVKDKKISKYIVLKKDIINDENNINEETNETAIEMRPGDKIYLTQDEIEKSQIILNIEYDTKDIKEQKMYNKKLTQTSEDGKKELVTVSGYMPVDTKLEVTQADISNIQDEVITNYPNNDILENYNIKLTSEENEYNPNEYEQRLNISILIDGKKKNTILEIEENKVQEIPNVIFEENVAKFEVENLKTYLVLQQNKKTEILSDDNTNEQVIADDSILEDKNDIATIAVGGEETKLKIDDYEKDKNYYFGLNYTENNSKESTGKYAENNLKDVTINYYGYDYNLTELKRPEKYDVSLNATAQKTTKGNITTTQEGWGWNQTTYYNRIDTITITVRGLNALRQQYPGFKVDSTWNFEAEIPNNNFSKYYYQEGTNNANNGVSVNLENDIITVNGSDSSNLLSNEDTCTFTFKIAFRSTNRNSVNNTDYTTLTTRSFKTTIQIGDDYTPYGTISDTEQQMIISYRKCIPVDNNGNISIELIDNPFANRALERGFNGWKTNDNRYANSINTNSNTFVQTLKTNINNIKDNSGEYVINLYVDWVEANVLFVSSYGSSSNSGRTPSSPISNEWTYINNKINSNIKTCTKASNREVNIIVLMQGTLDINGLTGPSTPYTLTSLYDGKNYGSTNTYLSAGSSNAIIDSDLQLDYIYIYSNVSYLSSRTSTDGTSSVAPCIYGNMYNLRIGRGIKSTNSSNCSLAQIQGGYYNHNSSEYKLVVESGIYHTIQLYRAGGGTGANTSTTANGTMVIGNDIDRRDNNNENLKFYNRISSRTNTSTNNPYTRNNADAIAINMNIKSGTIGVDYFNSASTSDSSERNYAGVYIGGHGQTGYDKSDRYLLIEGGNIANVIGGLNVGSDDMYKTYMYIKDGNIINITGGAGYTHTYGDRIIQVTGGCIKYSISGGSNGVAASSTSNNGQLTGNSLIYVGGDAHIGASYTTDTIGNKQITETDTNLVLYGVNAGSVCGGANGNENYAGQTDSSYIIIDKNATIHNNVFGGGNYGIIGSSQRRCYRKTNSYI